MVGAVAGGGDGWFLDFPCGLVGLLGVVGEVGEVVVGGDGWFLDFPCGLVGAVGVVGEVGEVVVGGDEWFLDFPCGLAGAVGPAAGGDEWFLDFPCGLGLPCVGAVITGRVAVLHGPTVSPCLRCAGSAFWEIVIVTRGCDFDPVRWQTTTFVPY